jgi:nickel-dependent lactate racemase
MTVVKVPTLLWYGDKELSLEFPDEWKVNVYQMEGHDSAALSDHEIKSSLLRTRGSESIRKMAESREECVIVVDDMTRPTRVYQLVPYILEELKAGGISDDHVRFIIALGAHGACNRIDFAKKLGEDIAAEYLIYNHNPFHNVTDLGKTSRGTPVFINSEFMNCDLRIGIGCIVPHLFTGFGGGAKIILPGISSIETIVYNHGVIGGFTGAKSNPHPTTGWGRYSDNIERLDAEEAARMAGLQIKIDGVLNSKAQFTGLFTGDLESVFHDGVKLASRIYSTQFPRDSDVVIANTYFKANEATLALWLSSIAIREGGTIVIIANAPDGQVTHYVYGKFGKKIGGPLYTGQQQCAKAGKVIIFSPYKIKDPFFPLLDFDKQILLNDWSEVLEEIKKDHKGKINVAVFPNADVQIPPESVQ